MSTSELAVLVMIRPASARTRTLADTETVAPGAASLGLDRRTSATELAGPVLLGTEPQPLRSDTALLPDDSGVLADELAGEGSRADGLALGPAVGRDDAQPDRSTDAVAKTMMINLAVTGTAARPRSAEVLGPTDTFCISHLDYLT